ncbi:SagB/ThcOx family dehydrogenase [Macrococcus hajekii]|uniref:SagB/ThcOx family dehydrogenase n=1 Tax=Macrococcus hajekii TaxID=198482 RepID=A0A4R6BHP7_9STAP|nr:SagB/ThcOx family dehydrogenase [Macrococcus hajekii]TDM01014.1 SagB/ThcOx family dehydrogenase [Macrococcus hajekii]GGB13192.1 hypothetical protein GCM10007190_21620 [Macrococcus hajekii]
MNRYKISESIVFFFKNGNFILDEYKIHNQKSINTNFIPLLEYLSIWRNEKDIIHYMNKNSFDTNILKVLVREGIVKKNLENELPYFKNWGKAVEYYHFNTKINENEQFENVYVEQNRIDDINVQQPNIVKNYNSTKIELPEPLINEASKNLINSLLDRETIRSFDENYILPLNVFSTILFLSFGGILYANPNSGSKGIYKTSPSGGGRSSIETYVIVHNVEGLDSGIYNYNVSEHSLYLINKGNFKKEAQFISGDQVHAKTCNFIVIYTSVLERIAWKYSTFRAYKAVYTDVGHLSQTLYLLANNYSLGAFYLGAVRDESIEKLLNISIDDEAILGISGVGMPISEENYSGRFIRKDYDYWRDKYEKN